MITSKSFYRDTTKGIDLIKVTHEVRQVVQEANVQNGDLIVVVPCPGAGVVVMEPGEKGEEMKKGLEPFVTNRLISGLLPVSLAMTIEKGKMAIEPWQEIFLIDYDSSGRRREFRVQVSEETAPAKEKGKQ